MAIWLSRTMCDVLDEMRTCNKTRNFCGIIGLIEEAQTMANRMEGGLEDIKSLASLADDIRDLKKEKKSLEKLVKDLKEERA